MNTYKQLSNKGKDFIRNETYTSIIVNSLVQLFEYKGLPDDTNIFEFENTLIWNGSAALVPYKDRFVPVTCKGIGMLNPEMKYDYYNTYYINHQPHKQNVPYEELAYCYNTKDRQPCLNILRFADLLSEVDLSMVFNVQRSRLAPIAVAEDDSQRLQIQNCLNATAKGNYEVITASILNNGTNQSGKVNILNLNDVTAIQYIQYLSEFHDSLTRRLYTMYGFAVQETSKHAQVNTDESNARDGVSWLIPDNMLECRKDFCRRFNKLYGTEITVDYSPLAKKEREIMESRSENNDTSTDTNNNNNTDSAAESNITE